MLTVPMLLCWWAWLVLFYYNEGGRPWLITVHSSGWLRWLFFAAQSFCPIICLSFELNLNWIELTKGNFFCFCFCFFREKNSWWHSEAGKKKTRLTEECDVWQAFAFLSNVASLNLLTDTFNRCSSFRQQWLTYKHHSLHSHRLLRDAFYDVLCTHGKLKTTADASDVLHLKTICHCAWNRTAYNNMETLGTQKLQLASENSWRSRRMGRVSQAERGVIVLMKRRWK